MRPLLAPEGLSHLVHVTQRLPVRVDEPCLRIGHTHLTAVGAHRRLGEPQMGAGHAREEMVLDLVVEAAEEPVGQGAAADVAGGEHLAAQMAPALASFGVGHLHALVVGREGHAQVEAEQRLVEGGEDECLAKREGGQQQRRVGNGMGHQEDGLHCPFPGRLSAQVPEAGDLQSDALKEREREEEPGLMTGQPAPEAGAMPSLFAGEHQDVGDDVGILLDVVGVGVVAVVLVATPW